jgi:DNA-directed RNA polymerase subunit RPC12/RpoP
MKCPICKSTYTAANDGGRQCQDCGYQWFPRKRGADILTPPSNYTVPEGYTEHTPHTLYYSYNRVLWYVAELELDHAWSRVWLFTDREGKIKQVHVGTRESLPNNLKQFIGDR